MQTAHRFLNRSHRVVDRIGCGGARPAQPARWRNQYLKPGGQYLIRLADTASWSPVDDSNYSVVIYSPHKYPSGTIPAKAADPRCKVLMYKTIIDMRDFGIGQAIPSQAVRFNLDTSVTYNEALVHDAANPSDKWILTSDGTTHLTPFFGFSSIYGGNISKTSFLDQVVLRLVEQLQAQPDWDGVWFDNITIAAPNGWSFELVNQTNYTNAYRDAIRYVTAKLWSHGYIVGTNSNYFVGGDLTSDTGVGVIGWFNTMGRDGADFYSNQFALQNPNDSAVTKLEGTASFIFYWQAWVTLVSITQALGPGISGVLNGFLNGTAAGNLNGRVARYVRASAYLLWDGWGLCWGPEHWQFAGPVTSWSGVPTIDMGQPVAAYTTDNGCYKRQFVTRTGAEMWVAVNPTQTQKTITVGVTQRVIASGDAYLGGPS